MCELLVLLAAVWIVYELFGVFGLAVALTVILLTIIT